MRSEVTGTPVMNLWNGTAQSLGVTRNEPQVLSGHTLVSLVVNPFSVIELQRARARVLDVGSTLLPSHTLCPMVFMTAARFPLRVKFRVP